jgi:hypothetical protein
MTARRWQRGELALCSCPGAQPAAHYVVRGCSPGGVPHVERDGEPHECLTAVAPARIRRPSPGRPALGATRRLEIGGELAAIIWGRAEAEGTSPEEAIRRAMTVQPAIAK